MRHFMKTVLLPALVALSGPSVEAQEAGQSTQLAPEDSFASENAVLDTSILFAIGAREARQELRGAFGWPTFQEGLVEGVYFRFDPDGYARFAPSPRLDKDVFEVICRPRTLVCMGRKDTLQVTLNNRGQVQLELASISENDQFILADGISELPLPATIIQPLEPRLELLLAAGGELIIRRQENEVDRVSLAGFGAVASYLRWVSARQDYTVLPRGWPVPNAPAGPESPGLTQTTLWQSGMQQPRSGIQKQTQAAAQTPPPAAGATAAPAQVGQDVAEVRGELNVLRELLLNRQTDAAPASPPAKGDANASSQTLETRVLELMQMNQSLQQELQRMQGTLPRASAQAQPAPGATPHNQTQNTRDVARHLEYLMTEVGLAPDVALMVVQQAQHSQQAAADMVDAEQEQVISDILKELRSQLPNGGAQTLTQQPMRKGSDYQLLSEYFRSTTQE